jgi:hypothetical protein
MFKVGSHFASKIKIYAVREHVLAYDETLYPFSSPCETIFCHEQNYLADNNNFHEKCRYEKYQFLSNIHTFPSLV